MNSIENDCCCYYYNILQYNICHRGINLILNGYECPQTNLRFGIDLGKCNRTEWLRHSQKL